MSAAWRLLTGLSAWEVIEIPRPASPDGKNGDGGDAPAGRHKRTQSLATACRAGSPVGFGWVREQPRGSMRVIAAGDGMRADDGTGTCSPDASGAEELLSFPVGARGQPLPPGGLATAFAVLPCWVPVAILPDELLRKELPGGAGTAGPGGGMSLDDGLLESWRGPFGWLVLAEPVSEERRQEMLNEVSLAQLLAQRHDSPRAMIAARRTKVRHDELREAVVTGLWNIWLVAGARSPAAAAKIAGLVCASLDLRGLPFGLTERKDTRTLPELLGAPPETTPAAEPGPLAREVLAMYRDDATAAARTRGEADTAATTDHGAGTGWGNGAVRSPRDGEAATRARWEAEAAAHRSRWDNPGGAGMPGPAPGYGPVSAGTGLRPGWLGGAQAPASQAGLPGAASGQVAGAANAADFPDPEPRFPCVASSELLAALAVPPAEEVPGVRMVLRPRFDVTPERPKTGPGTGIGLGTVLDRNRDVAGPLVVPEASLNRHVFVCGATGAGKSQTVRHLLESAASAGIPWLVIEPAKAEYRLMAARLPDADVVTIKPGDLGAVPAGINPLEPAAGPDGKRFPLQAHADLVRALFLAAFRADEPFPQVLSAALTRCYTEAGWDLVTGEAASAAARYPTLAHLQDAALAVVEEIGYSREITDNVRGFVSVRIGSLRTGTTGGFLDGAFPLDYGRLLSGNVVLEIEDCGDDTDKAFLTGAVLVRLTEHLRMRARAEGPSAPGLRHLTVVEEAHRLLRQPAQGEGGGPAAHAVEMFAGLLAEIRAYGEGLVIAEQIPSKLLPDAIKNTAVKVVHRLPAKDDRDAVGATMNLTDEQSRFLVTLVPGEAAVFTDGMDYPVLARMPDGTARETAGAGRSAKRADALVTSRSLACPAECGSRPCTLGQIAAARRVRGRDPRLALWAELSVLSHLTGWPVPEPGAEFAAALDRLDGRTRDCALAHAAEEAAESRRAVIMPRVDPGALAGHVAAAMRAVLAGGPGCPDDEQQWLAPVCEWNLVADALGAAIRQELAGRHPRSAEWEQVHDRVIPGADCAAQLAVVTAWQDQEWRQDGKRVTTIFGTGKPSGIETALGVRRSAPGWADRIRQAMAGTFTIQASVWAPDLLAPRPDGRSGDSGSPRDDGEASETTWAANLAARATGPTFPARLAPGPVTTTPGTHPPPPGGTPP